MICSINYKYFKELSKILKFLQDMKKVRFAEDVPEIKYYKDSRPIKQM